MLLKPSFNVQARLGLDSITMLSIRQPALEVLKSLAMRQRRTIVCPAAEAGSVTLPDWEVSQSGAGLLALVAVQPGGSGGAVTPPKFSANMGVDWGISGRSKERLTAVGIVIDCADVPLSVY